MNLSVPVLDDDADTLSAALQYAAAGWYVGPCKPDLKHAGTVLGKHWHTKTSRDPKVIASWFAGTDYSVFLHVGRSGAVAMDVDRPDDLPDVLTDAVEACQPPKQTSRVNEPDRCHYVFLQPPGRMIGNSSGKLTTEWGEVRGKNGVIIVAPSVHAKAAEGGRYEWLQTGEVPLLPESVAALLPDAGASIDAATDGEVRTFFELCTVGNQLGLLRAVESKLTAAFATGGSRHDAALKHACWAMREARAGCYPAKIAAQQIRKLFTEAVTTRRNASDRQISVEEARSEFDGIVAWAVSQAGLPDVLDVQRGVAARTGTGIGDDDEIGKPPPIPDPVMFRGVLGDVCRAIAPHTEADPVGVLVTLLSKAGGIIGQKPHMMVGPTRHPLLIWPMLFGRSGTGAKGEAESAASLFIRAASPESMEFTSGGLSSGEGLIERIKDPLPEPPAEELDIKAALAAQKAAKEAGGTDNKRLILTEEEFASVMSRSSWSGSTLGSVLRLAWAGARLSVLNRNAYVASSSHVAIVAHITPREFRLKYSAADMAGGTLNRFLPVYVERSKSLPVPPRIDPLMVRDMAAKVCKAISDASCIGEVTMDDNAVELWTDELYAEFRGGDDEDTAAGDFTKRAAPYCLRIAALFATLDNRSVINIEDMRAAAALVRYSVKTAWYALDAAPRDPRMDRLRRALDAAPNGLTKTEISALFSRKLKAPVLDELLKILLERDEYERLDEPTGGRPTVRYRRKPAEADAA